jgi:predicted nucleic acid-binding protein
LAVNGHAGVIVSGDADLLVLDVFQGIPIINPAAFTYARVMRP